MASVIRAIHMPVGGCSALVALCDDLTGNTLTEALVEDKVHTLKLIGQPFLFRLVCVFDDPSVELVHLFESAVLHIRARFFAANAACAIHDDGFVFLRFQHFGHQGQRLPESRHIGAQGPFKMPHFAFVVVAHIDHNGIRVIGQFIKFPGRQVFSPFCHIKTRVVQTIGHDFPAHLDRELVKRSPVVLHGNIEPDTVHLRYAVDPLSKLIQLVRRQRNLSIDPLVRHINTAVHPDIRQQNIQTVPKGYGVQNVKIPVK